ncbi:hypothetical protein JTE90_017695 [Oedothorax gibbosus]|uniref:Reverse transcriptase n=1 Tax=Oedothorax gibbosus TaxID=931172 RepID=A0AAV6UZR9_9ARAC|nr:hypothetical protein JTE90_017695 [Oedothorax gibbosus]
MDSLVGRVQNLENRIEGWFSDRVSGEANRERYDLPGCDTLLHRINLTTEHPIRQHPYRVPQQLKPELNRQVNELLESGIVQESESPNLAPVLLVRKKDGTYRLCTDLRRLNEHTVPLPYPIPNITQLVDNLGARDCFLL